MWIDCTAVGGIPDSHILTLFYANQQVTTALAVGNSLHVSVAINRFGEYTCIVESLYNITQVSLFLQEKGIIYVLYTPDMCGILCIIFVHVYIALFQLLLAEDQPASECTPRKVYTVLCDSLYICPVIFMLIHMSMKGK